MYRDELIQMARVTYEWQYLLSSIGFRKSDTETLKDKSTLTIWQRETSQGLVEFSVKDEDSPAYLSPGTESNKGKWEKFDVILKLHAGDDLSSAAHFINSGDNLLTGPLAEISREAKEVNQLSSLDLTLEERLETDPQFQSSYERSLRELSARQAAEETLSSKTKKGMPELQTLSIEEVAEVTGLVNWEELWDDETEERWFVEGLLCEGRGHACPAEAGIGKSLLWLEVGAGLASGAPVLGKPAQEPIKVLYLDNENSPRGDVKPRLQAMGFGPEDLSNFMYLSFPNIEALNTKLGGQNITQLLDYFQPNLVFIDTFSRFVEGDENSSAVAQEFYLNVGQELKKRAVAYLRLDHIGKDASRGARGSSAKGDDLDIIWTMSRTKEENVFTLKNQKARVPVPASEIIIDRTNSPLRHKIRSASQWPKLIAIADKHEIAVSLIKGLDSSHSLAQGKVWTDLREECQKYGIIRKELFSALEFVKGPHMPLCREAL